MGGKRPIRVLQVCTIFLTAQTFIAPVLRYLSGRGYEAAVACSQESAADGPVSPGSRNIEGCQVFSVAIPRTIRPLQDLPAIRQLCRVIREFKPDVIHTQTSKAGIVGRLAARLAGVPVIIHTAHAFPFHAYLPWPVQWAYIWIERWVAGWTDLIMVDTESVRMDGLRQRIVQDASRIVTVPMGVDLTRFSPSLGGPGTLRDALGLGRQALVVGTVARLVPDKGLECFLRMAAIIRAERADVKFLIVGEGPLRQSLEQMAELIGIGPDVVFAGHRTDIPELMQAMDLFVLPTRREGFGVVFAEAMAMGKATVGSDIGPIAEVLEDGVTGYLAPADNPEAFAARTLELLNDNAKRRTFGEAGRRRVEQLFSQSRMCELIEGHYRRLLAQKGFVL
ncbi:MAG: glycosyltransferase family 4 protein [Nitrospira sp.]|nr:MAG: glycosyltransferase family 4 protein [Nitrospira sp. CG24D]